MQGHLWYAFLSLSLSLPCISLYTHSHQRTSLSPPPLHLSVHTLAPTYLSFVLLAGTIRLHSHAGMPVAHADCAHLFLPLAPPCPNAMQYYTHPNPNPLTLTLTLTRTLPQCCAVLYTPEKIPCARRRWATNGRRRGTN